MPRRNRLDPTGALLAVLDRGTLWGNRGPLLGPGGDLRRHHTGKGWVVCLLEYKGWQRVQWRPGRLTELYLLDEATGLAAGHRPCGLCRHADHEAFKAAWGAAHPGTSTRAPAIDAVLHEQRLTPRTAPPRATVPPPATVPPRATVPPPADRREPLASRQRTHAAPFPALPDGAMIGLDGASWLVLGDALHRWTPGGYVERTARPGRGDATVLTPPGTVATLRAGYRAGIHPSAGQGASAAM